MALRREQQGGLVSGSATHWNLPASRSSVSSSAQWGKGLDDLWGLFKMKYSRMPDWRFQVPPKRLPWLSPCQGQGQEGAAPALFRAHSLSCSLWAATAVGLGWASCCSLIGTL